MSHSSGALRHVSLNIKPAILTKCCLFVFILASFILHQKRGLLIRTLLLFDGRELFSAFEKPLSFAKKKMMIMSEAEGL